MMTHIDKTRPVLVTGATGYVAGWIIKLLLEEGLTVHATVRDPQDKKRTAHLDRLAAASKGQLRYFKADLLKENSFMEAMAGCELVYHTASPFITVVKDPEKELIRPAVNGTENVLETVNQTASVKRVVLTSSCAAMYTDATDCSKGPGGCLDESVWNTTASLSYQPYSYSKLLAEKKAWEMAGKQSRWDLITINPSLVLGPMLNPQYTTSESINFLKQFGDGTMKAGAPRLGLGLVDVRDVARAHLMAGFTPEAKGRYLTSAHNTNLLEMALALRPRFGKHFPLPEKALPKWLMLLIGPSMNKILTRRMIRNNVNIEWKADNSKIRREFKMDFIPLQKTMEDSFQVLVDEKILLAKN